ncbi:MAG TPA: methylated-DNA--[protein]-cysteine S-methyltransferase [Lactobacillus sp.]|nr:methylated-DNA--[protein]-cysteine S-methyltransferase [Lactobacillus sp.]
MVQLYHDAVDTSVGELQLLVSQKGLVFVGSPNAPLTEAKQYLNDAESVDHAKTDEHVTAPYRTEISDYFDGQRQDFDLPIDHFGTGTHLQQAVWDALVLIPYGMTCDYSTIAVNIGQPTAIRAVATAIAKNPVLIVTPCHRVLRKDGGLGGYRGGLTMKKQLLALERANS